MQLCLAGKVKSVNAPQPSNSPRFGFLDALRGLAILGVVSTHCAWFAGGDFRGRPFAFAGLYGVQLFFMVSAFTIFLTLERALARERVPVAGFYIRRLLRIVPMFWVGILLYAFAPGREHYYTNSDLGASYYALTAMLQHGWHPYYINTVVPGGWSIAVEATFYIFAPLLFFRVQNWRRAVYLLLGSLLLYGAANNFLRIATDHQWVFTNIEPHELLTQFSNKWFPSQLPVFACGILTFYLLKAMPEGFHTRRNGLLLLCAALMLLYNAVDIGSHRLLPEQVVFALGFLPLMLAVAIHPFPLVVNPAVCFLGRISYSFYLMHFVVMDAEVRWCHRLLPGLFTHPALAYLALFALTLVLATPVAWTTYRFVEQPFIRLGSGIVRRLNAAPEKTPKAAAVLTPTDS
jgi:peptidoglycan/LPS O-acetylase OafA/YrhL